jgi:small subunit ribosomal protein S11
MQKQARKTYNNTIITARCLLGNTIFHVVTEQNLTFTISAGVVGFMGSKRGTSQAAQDSAQLVGKRLREQNLRNVILIFKGLSKTRKSVIKGLKKRNIIIKKILDVTSIAHNGCRSSNKSRK